MSRGQKLAAIIALAASAAVGLAIADARQNGNRGLLGRIGVWPPEENRIP